MTADNLDLVQPFQLETPNLRGRMVRLGPAATAIVQRHAYPPEVARLLVETLAVTVLLAGMLKYDGVFTLQAKGDGPISLLVADVTSTGAMRAYAQFDAERAPALAPKGSLRELLGKGYLAFTVDQGEAHERYQGIVELVGDRLADFVQHYFNQSEQLETTFELAAAQTPEGGWTAGGIMLQRLPAPSNVIALTDVEDWRRSNALLKSVRPAELTDAGLAAPDLLFRLFHEEDVRLFPASTVADQCRCSRERVAGVLKSLGQADREHLQEDKVTSVKCEFCGRDYTFTAEELASLDAPPDETEAASKN